MWRSPSSHFLIRSFLPRRLPFDQPIRPWGAHFCSSTTPPTSNADDSKSCPTYNSDNMSYNEAKKLIQLVNVEELKKKLGMETREVIGYKDLLDACEGMAVARTKEEVVAFTKALDDAGVVLLFRDKVYLHPDKVVDLVRSAVPFALSPENDPRLEELKDLQKKKEDIDMIAHKQVRRILYSGLGFFLLHVGLFFRLTFWEFSWDVMEPITYFTTAAGISVGYAYFLSTSSDPTYQDLMKRLFLSRQRKLIQKNNFNLERFKELQKQCGCPSDRTRATELDGIHAALKG